MPLKSRPNETIDDVSQDLVAINDRITQLARDSHLSQQTRDEQIQSQF